MNLRQLVAAALLVASSTIARADSSPPAAPAPASAPVVSNVPEKLDPNCREAITPTTAKRLFDVLNKPLSGGACQFSGVSTETNVLTATWTANGKSLPPVRVAAAGCLNAQHSKDTLVASVPPEVAAACLGVKPLLDDFLKSLSGEHAIAVLPAPRHKMGNLFFNIAYGLLVVAALLIAFWQYFWKKPAGN